MPNAVLKPIPSIWGHFAGFGVNTADTDFIDRAIRECLAEEKDAGVGGASPTRTTSQAYCNPSCFLQRFSVA